MAWFSWFKSNKTSERKYEGASKSKRLSRWKTNSTSANTEIAGGLSALRDRARDLRRNNPYAAKGIQVISSNVIGHGIRTQFRGQNDTPGNETPLEKLWKDWAHSKEIDYDGRHDLFGLQRLVMDAVVESGEVLVRKRYTTKNKFPLQYQVLEGDFLNNTLTIIGENGNQIIQGIEFDKQGRRVAYHLWESHPGGYDKDFFVPSLKTNRVLAKDIFHIYRMDRPGQARGVPWLSPVIIRLKDLDDYEDAQLVRQKIAACFTAFVRDIGADMTDQDETCGDDLGDKIEPALIEHLPPGKTIEFADPPSVENYKEYITTLLHGIAAGLGVTYEALTGDLSSVNFSSARMGWLEFQRNIETWRQHIIISHFLDPVVEDFKRLGAVMGLNFESVTHVHTPPRREMIDPTKEVPAKIKAIRSGLSTLSDEIMALGKDPQDHLAQVQKDLLLLDKLGITLDSDPRKKDDSGKLLEENNGGNNEEENQT